MYTNSFIFLPSERAASFFPSVVCGLYLVTLFKGWDIMKVTLWFLRLGCKRHSGSIFHYLHDSFSGHKAAKLWPCSTNPSETLGGETLRLPVNCQHHLVSHAREPPLQQILKPWTSLGSYSCHLVRNTESDGPAEPSQHSCHTDTVRAIKIHCSLSQ